MPGEAAASVADSATRLAGDTREHDAYRICTASRKNGADAAPKRLICVRNTPRHPHRSAYVVGDLISYRNSGKGCTRALIGSDGP